MPRFIDAEKLKAHYSWWDIGSEEHREFKKIFDTIIDVQPTADVVPVVRCKDCKHWRRDVIFHDAWCRGRHQPNPNWFCADGERRTDDDRA